MPTQEMTLNEIRARGYEALLRELGPIGYTRFVQQFYAGEGNYTEWRQQLVDRISGPELQQMIEDHRTRVRQPE